MTNFLPNPHTSYDPYGQRIAPADISREDANALTLANRQADPSKFRGFIFDTLMRMGADPGQASLFGAPASFMPVLGDMQDIEDVGYAASQGDYMGAALGAGLAAVPFLPARGVMKHARKPQGIKAYHGSPHDFDKFSMDKIGTGEGAQAYGHGLYFAENEDVARSYKGDVSKQALRERANDFGPDIAMEYDLAGGKLGEMHGQLELLRNYVNREGLPADEVARATDLADRLEEYLHVAPREVRPTMYEVNINANPDDFLDWDAPLSEQPENIRNAVTGVNVNDDPLLAELLDTSPEGMMLQGMVPNAKGSAAYKTLAEGGREASVTDKLRAAGVPGIKYFDGGSRAAGEGSRNYVVFDDSLVSIVKKYGIAGAISMGLISQQQGEEMQAQGLI